MTASKQSRLWMVAGAMIALLLVAGTYLFVVSPARDEVASVQSQADDATLQQSLLRHRLTELDATAKSMNGLKSQVAAAKAALPATVDTQGLLRRVQAVAASTGATVSSVSIQGAQPSVVDGVSAVPVSMNLSGSADQLVDVLDQLQSNQQRLMTVSSAALKAASGDATLFQLDLTIQAYASSPPAAAVAGGTTATGAGASAPTAGGAAAQPSNPAVAS